MRLVRRVVLEANSTSTCTLLSLFRSACASCFRACSTTCGQVRALPLCCTHYLSFLVRSGGGGVPGAGGPNCRTLPRLWRGDFVREAIARLETRSCSHSTCCRSPWTTLPRLRQLDRLIHKLIALPTQIFARLCFLLVDPSECPPTKQELAKRFPGTQVLKNHLQAPGRPESRRHVKGSSSRKYSQLSS